MDNIANHTIHKLNVRYRFPLNIHRNGTLDNETDISKPPVAININPSRKNAISKVAINDRTLSLVAIIPLTNPI